MKDERQVRGYSIIENGNLPKIIDNETFLVPSQSNNKKYKVVLQNEWRCECPDFQFRQQKCKHIYAVEFLLKLRQKLDNDSSLEFAKDIQTVSECQFCNSKNIVKNGRIKNKSEMKQRFWCKDCNRTFYENSNFNYIRNPKIITLAFDLYFKGMSLRKITDTLNQFFGVKIHHETVRRWLIRFTTAMNDYVSELTPKVSDAWHVDEQAIKIKGKQAWSWNVLDENTRFLIANAITEKREINDARQVFQKAKDTAKINPEFIITDGLFSYEKAIKKEFKTSEDNQRSVKHVRLTSIRDVRVNNNLIERYHSTFRERDKVMRGFKERNSTKAIVDGFNLNYNFIRKHQGLNGMTPAEKSGIDLELERNRWLSLLTKSLKK